MVPLSLADTTHNLCLELFWIQIRRKPNAATPVWRREVCPAHTSGLTVHSPCRRRRGGLTLAGEGHGLAGGVHKAFHVPVAHEAGSTAADGRCSSPNIRHHPQENMPSPLHHPSHRCIRTAPRGTSHKLPLPPRYRLLIGLSQLKI